MEDTPLTIFLHLPKTGGTTLREIVRRAYGRDEVWDLDDMGDVHQLESAPDERKRQLRVVQGHLTIGLHRTLGAPCQYVTMLRDPVDRVASEYFWIRRHPIHPDHESATEMTLLEFVQTGADPDLDNGQTRLLSSLGPDATQACSPEHLEEAIQNLRSPLFAVVGVTERFEQTLVLIQAVLDWATPWYTDANVTRRRPRVEQLDPAAVKVIEERNPYDRALHQLALQRLDEGIAALGPRYEVLSRRLRRHNRWMSHVGSVRTLISNVRRSDST